jgi:hypothetical protein
MPELIQNFFNANFDLDNFRKENLYIIREYAIKDYVDNLQHNSAKEYIDTMVKYSRKRVSISDDFPCKKLYEIMKPYLYYYFIANYSLCFEKRRDYFDKLTYKLKRFFKFNPNFGKKYIKFEKILQPGTIDNPFIKNTCKKRIIVFDDKHINFYEKENDTFLTSHVKNETNDYDFEDDDDDDAPINIINADIDLDDDEVSDSEEEEEEEEEWNQMRNQMQNEVQNEVLEILLNQENENGENEYDENEEKENDSVS